MSSIFARTAMTGLFTLATVFAFSQEDAENCKDHPLFNRISNFYIQECSQNYNEKEFVVGNDKTVTHEGDVLTIMYTYGGSYGPHLPSKLQVIRNYENAILAKGGKKIFSRASGDDWTGGTYQLFSEGKEYWVSISNLINDPVDQFTVTILAKEAMKQEITANAIFEQISTGGSVALYINFETGKSVIQQESLPIVEELYTMLSTNPSLKISIEGHTDNTGTAAGNQTLSQQRAESVKQALVKKGIQADRIKTAGFGQSKPIADNSTEEGKAKNRRVEIRKM